jgi:AcrR family transcriptional regulator
MTKSDISPNQERFIAALLSTRTIADAARQVGISERTAYRYLDDPEVRAALDSALNQALSSAAQRAAAGMDHALATLSAILDDPNTPLQPRINVARLLIEAGPRLHETITLMQRMESIERRL